MRLWCCGLTLLLAGAARGDVIHLVDGSQIEGLIRRQGNEWVVTETSGKVIYLTDNQIARIEKTGNLTDAQRAQSQLNALRHDVEALTDAAVAAERFRKFIETHPATPAAADAQKDLATWQSRVTQKFIKAGANWVPADEYNQLMLQTMGLIQQAREAYKQGRQRDVEIAVASILALEPNNPSALYLRGLVLAKQDQIATARRSFERVQTLVSNHGPTLNNLAVLNWQQKTYERALGLYDQAMQAAPRNRQILDNVAEALHALPPDLVDNATAKKLSKQFEDQDAELQKDLAEQSLHRYGAQYLTDTQLQQAKTVEEKFATQRQTVDDEFIRTRQRITDIESLVNMNAAQMDDMERRSWQYDALNTVWVRVGLPNMYWELARQNRMLDNEHTSMLRRLDELAMQVRVIDQNAQRFGYTGKQRLIESDGVPLKLPAALPSTNPATRPDD